MKELSIEQKAKAYDEALKVLHKYDGVNIMFSLSLKEEMFPELKENEDDKIRKALISKYQGDGCLCNNKLRISYKDIRDWLEKQSEQKSIDSLTQQEAMDIAVAKCFEQGEQTPTDKTEPKFKVGDFIVNDYCMGKVTELTNDAYLLDTGQGIPFSCEHNAHLWTIQDANDGDVLTVERDETPFIFKGFDKFHQGCPVAYCGIDDSGIFVNSDDGWWTDEKVHPATKEQRDFLFQKMKEAGYKWDAEKKELKKIEQKPAIFIPKFRVGDIVKDSFNDVYHIVEIEDDSYRTDNGRFILFKNEDAYSLVEHELIEWSEEDEAHFNKIYEVLHQYAYASHTDIHLTSNDATELISWLKSLRPQKQWKPTKMQLECLKEACDNHFDFDGLDPLYTLYEQLKALL